MDFGGVELHLPLITKIKKQQQVGIKITIARVAFDFFNI